MSHKSEILRSVIFFVFFTVITCPALTVPNAQIQDPSSDPYQFNDVVKFVCNTGYQLVSGDLSRTCRSDGTWSGDPAVCKSRNHVYMLRPHSHQANANAKAKKYQRTSERDQRKKFKHQRKKRKHYRNANAKAKKYQRTSERDQRKKFKHQRKKRKHYRNFHFHIFSQL